MMIIWALLAAAAGLTGIRYRRRISAVSRGGRSRLDDEALRRIIEDGHLHFEHDEPLDLDEVARAEEEFWEERWDEPEEFRP